MRRIRLLLVEVDGALLTPEGRLTARASAAVRLLRAAGVELALTSCRPPRGLRMLIEALRVTTPLSSCAGGRLVRPDLSLLEEHPLDDRVALAVIAAMERHGLDVWVYQNDEWLVRRAGACAAREQAAVQFAPTVVERWEGVVRDAIKIVAVGEDAGALPRCEAELADLYGRASTARREPCYLDVTHPRANKGEVARALARRLGVPAEAMATIGVLSSDVLMFRECGLAIAMGHACAAVQRQAQFITRSNDDEGFAHAVETWVVTASGGARAAGG